MFERDYLMKLLVQFFAAVVRSIQNCDDSHDPKGSAELLECAIGEAVNLDTAVMLSLAPESLAAVMCVSGEDPQVMEYVSRGLLLVARYYREAHNVTLAAIREQQAYALAQAYGLSLSEKSADELLHEAQLFCS